YGIMEKAEGVLCIPAEFGWNDVGSWDSLEKVFRTDDKGNVRVGDCETIDCKNNVFFDKTGKKLIAGIGLTDLVVVNTDDAILVCSKERVQDVKAMVDRLKDKGREELL
ncbi:MAG TPA: mannose-1-phosphate guanylyltransferase, partial [Clostridiales bacterium]|nr:mannose-1-phosphate guanylyltransferase [Clostridiales bacterium]